MVPGPMVRVSDEGMRVEEEDEPPSLAKRIWVQSLGDG